MPLSFLHFLPIGYAAILALTCSSCSSIYNRERAGFPSEDRYSIFIFGVGSSSNGYQTLNSRTRILAGNPLYTGKLPRPRMQEEGCQVDTAPSV